MALPVWPASLPTRPLQDGTAIDSLDLPPVKTPMEDGFGRQRQRSTTNLTDLTVQFVMDAAQAQAFITFVRNDLRKGTQRFQMPIWSPGAVDPLQVKTVQIQGGAAAVQLRNAGLYEYVTFPIRVLDF